MGSHFLPVTPLLKFRAFGLPTLIRGRGAESLSSRDSPSEVQIHLQTEGTLEVLKVDPAVPILVCVIEDVTELTERQCEPELLVKGLGELNLCQKAAGAGAALVSHTRTRANEGIYNRQT